jgi:hypothetical protein
MAGRSHSPMASHAARLLVSIVLALSSGCISGTLDSGIKTCGANSACPPGYECHGPGAGKCYLHGRYDGGSDAIGSGTGGGGASGSAGTGVAGGGGAGGGAGAGVAGATGTGGASDGGPGGSAGGAAGATPGPDGGVDAPIQPMCTATQHLCGSSCVDNASIDHCGSISCFACSPPMGATATCDGKSCGFTCGTGLKTCGTACIAASACCDDSGCTQPGKVGKCDSSTHTCSFNCAGTTKPCNGACIAAGNCCVDLDCGTMSGGQVGTCAAATGVCSYSCPTNTKLCGSTCIPSNGCCQQSDCPGACQSCVNNACTPVRGQDDTDSCSGTCDTNGVCRAKGGQGCTSAAGGCVAGTTCSPDGVCCDQACAGPCLACNLQGSVGTCMAVGSGPPHTGHGTCGSGSCAGACAGNADGSCSFPTGTCGAQSCTGTSFVDFGTCASGQCVSPPARTCSGVNACSGNLCKNKSCTGDGDCPSGFCENSVCHLKAMQVSVGTDFACIRLSDGTIRCWGKNDLGQLGNGTTTASTTPVPVTGIANAIAVSAGLRTACALLTGGTVKCWGDDYFGTVGDGGAIEAGSVNKPTPVSVVGLNGTATSIAVSYTSACAVAGGGVQCWGRNDSFELGVGDIGKDAASTPVTLDLKGSTAVSLWTCPMCGNFSVIMSDGSYWGWGSSMALAHPVKVTAGPVVGATNTSNFAAIFPSGSVTSWSVFDPGLPATVTNLVGATALSANLAITGAAGNVQIWNNLNTQPLINITGITGANTISYNGFEIGSCATTTRGTVYCWTNQTTVATEIVPSW